MSLHGDRFQKNNKNRKLRFREPWRCRGRQLDELMRSLFVARRRGEGAGRRGIRGNSAKKNKSKRKRILVVRMLFLEHVTATLVERTSPPRLLPVASATGRSSQPGSC
jgi:hypothetical protein